MAPSETNEAEQSLILPPETLDGLQCPAPVLESPLIWNCPFVLPGWLKSWWACFHEDWVPYLWGLKRGSRWLGLAPMMLRGEEARFMGSAEVCDHLDFLLSPGEEDHFLEVFLTHLRDRGSVF